METQTRDQIQKLIDGNAVIVFMKGTKNFPQCGFSATVAEVMRRLEVEFADVNVLADNNIRQGIKEFSNWPTIPQVYVRGKFVGGCDIIRDMYENGELESLVKQPSAGDSAAS